MPHVGAFLGGAVRGGSCPRAASARSAAAAAAENLFEKVAEATFEVEATTPATPATATTAAAAAAEDLFQVQSIETARRWSLVSAANFFKVRAVAIVGGPLLVIA